MLEAPLFDESDGIVILVELNPAQTGARDEALFHAQQADSHQKVQLLLPPHSIAEMESGNFWSSIVRQGYPRSNRIGYSEREYRDCQLVQYAKTWAEDLKRRLDSAVLDEWRKGKPS